MGKISKQKKIWKKRKIDASAKIEGKVIWVGEETQTSIRNRENGYIDSTSFLLLLDERPSQLIEIADVERLNNSVNSPSDDADKFVLFISCLSCEDDYENIERGLTVECRVKATPTGNGENKMIFNATKITVLHGLVDREPCENEHRGIGFWL